MNSLLWSWSIWLAMNWKSECSPEATFGKLENSGIPKIQLNNNKFQIFAIFTHNSALVDNMVSLNIIKFMLSILGGGVIEAQNNSILVK